MFISEALANAGQSAGQGNFASIAIQLGLVFLIFYFLLIRPQQKKMKQHTEMLMNIKKGDMIVTGGGIYAEVKKIEDMYITVEIAEGTEIVINRSTIRDVVGAEDKKAVKTKAETAVAKKTEKKTTKATAAKTPKTTKSTKTKTSSKA